MVVKVFVLRQVQHPVIRPVTEPAEQVRLAGAPGQGLATEVVGGTASWSSRATFSRPCRAATMQRSQTRAHAAVGVGCMHTCSASSSAGSVWGPAAPLTPFRILFFSAGTASAEAIIKSRSRAGVIESGPPLAARARAAAPATIGVDILVPLLNPYQGLCPIVLQMSTPGAAMCTLVAL